MMKLTDTLSFVKMAHEGQVDRGGTEYWKHPLAVASLVAPDVKAMTVALLHDVIEDTKYELVDLFMLGYSCEIVYAVGCLTQRKNESANAYFKRVKESPLAVKVKIADMTHNSLTHRLNKDELSVEDKNRVKYYKKRIKELKEG